MSPWAWFAAAVIFAGLVAGWLAWPRKRRKRGTALSRQLGCALIEDAMGRVEGALPPEVAPLGDVTGQGPGNRSNEEAP